MRVVRAQVVFRVGGGGGGSGGRQVGTTRWGENGARAMRPVSPSPHHPLGTAHHSIYRIFVHS